PHAHRPSCPTRRSSDLSETVARAPPDGYTLLVAPTGFSINPGLYKKLPFDPLRDFAPISVLGLSYAVVVVNPQSPVRTIQDLIADRKSTRLNSSHEWIS